jgi:hypothetical protein
MHRQDGSHGRGRGAASARAGLLGLLLLGGLGACAWSVPADPGALARLRGAQGAGPDPSATVGETPRAASDPGARTLYLEHCGRCHEPFAPDIMAAQDWPRYVQRYAPRAGLWGRDRARVLAWLEAHAR